MIGLLVAAGLVTVSAPSPAHADTEAGNYLWVTTDQGTMLYSRTADGLQALPAPGGGPTIADAPLGQAVYSPLEHQVWIPEQDGIRYYRTDTLGGGPFFGSGNDYKQVALSPDGATIAGLRADGTAIDVFGSSSPIAVRTIAIDGVAGSMSDVDPDPTRPVVVVGYTHSDGTHRARTVDLATGGGTDIVQSATASIAASGWNPDGTELYLATASPVPAENGITRYTAATGATSFVATPSALPAQQMKVSPAGGRLYLAAAGGGVFAFDTTAMSFLYFGEPFGQSSASGYAPMDVALSPEGDAWLYAPTIGTSAVLAIEFGSFGPTTNVVPLPDPNTPVYGATVVDLPAQYALVGNNQSTVVSTPFAQPVGAEVRDVNGVPMRGVWLQALLIDGDARFPGNAVTYRAPTDANGAFVLPLTVGASSGPVEIDVGIPNTTQVIGTLELAIVPATPPGAPRIDSLTGGDGFVQVAFTPGSDGTFPTTSYVVTATNITDPAATGITASGPASPITVEGLTNGDAYTFTVQAINPGGSPVSARSDAITVGVPASVTVLPGPATVGKPYLFTFEPTGVPTPTMTLDVGTPLPDGLTWNPATLTISGTPTEAALGSTYVQFFVSNALANDVGVPVTFEVAAAVGSDQPAPEPSTTPTTPVRQITGGSNPAAGGGGNLPATGGEAPTAIGAGGLALLLFGGSLLAARRLRRRREN